LALVVFRIRQTVEAGPQGGSEPVRVVDRVRERRAERFGGRFVIGDECDGTGGDRAAGRGYLEGRRHLPCVRRLGRSGLVERPPATSRAACLLQRVAPPPATPR